MRTSKAVGQRANGKGGEWVDRQRRMMRRLWWDMVEPRVQLIRAPFIQLRVDYTCTMSDNKGSVNDKQQRVVKGFSNEILK